MSTWCPRAALYIRVAFCYAFNVGKEPKEFNRGDSMYGNGYGYGYGYGSWNRGGYAPQPMGVPPQTQPFNGYQNQAPQQETPPASKPSLQVPWVNGEVGAQAYLIAPNSTVLLMDSDNPIFYIKTSDLSGKATIQAFKYEELRQSPQAASPMYVTREEFESFKQSISKKPEEEQKI